MMPRTNPRAAAFLAAQITLICAAVSVRADLQSDIDSLVQVPELQYAHVGIHIVQVGADSPLYSRDADVRMQPASNLKLITSAAAFDLLGPDFTYRTRVCLDQALPKDGILRGPIYLKGSGDPSLTHKQLEAFAHSAVSNGLRRVEGDLIVDASVFADRGLGTGWSWDYLNDYYAAEISGLTVDRGCVKAIVRGAGAPGTPPLFRLDPFSEYMALAPGILTSPGTCDAPGIFRHLSTNTLGLDGPIGVDQKVERSITVRDPALYAGALFKQYLRKAGVPVSGAVRHGETPTEHFEFLDVESLPLAKLLKHVGKDSDNNYSEQIQRTISAVKAGEGSRRESVRLIDDWAGSFGADPMAFLMYDGSGLSRLNCVTPRFLTQLLSHMQEKSIWVETLPIMGRDGTLRSRMVGTAAEGQVQAKTGYIGGVRALSGYAQSESGKTMVFSILVNNALNTQAASRMQDKICLLLVAL